MKQTNHFQPVSRRNFLKWGCVGAAAVGVTACAGTMAFSALAGDEEVGSQVEQPQYTFGQSHTTGRVLLAYASATGSTAEIAKVVGETFAGQGWAVDVYPMEDHPAPEGYQAVLLGSAVQHGNWLPEALDYVKTHQQALAKAPVALFSVHITNQGNDAESRAIRETFSDAVKPYVQPVTEVFFAGRFNRQGAALMMPRWIAPFIPTIDLRKWDLIDTWAKNLPAKLFA